MICFKEGIFSFHNQTTEVSQAVHNDDEAELDDNKAELDDDKAELEDNKAELDAKKQSYFLPLSILKCLIIISSLP